MLTKILILLGYNSRRIVAGGLFIYLFILVLLKRTYFNGTIPDKHIYLFFILLGFYFGMNVMAKIIRFLNKSNIVNHPTFQKLISNNGK